jgi:DNA-binding transcriptional LysR family regulator
MLVRFCTSREVIGVSYHCTSYHNQTAGIGYHMQGNTEGSASSLRRVLPRLRLIHLHLLEILVQHGTVRKAAEELNLSQPAVSQMLKDLESAFGGTLFTRTRKGVVPNERLRALLRRVQVVLGELDAVQSELRTVPRPTIRLGANLQFLTQHVPTALARVSSNHPDLRFILREGSTRVAIDSLLRGELDCVIGPTRSLSPTKLRELRFWPLYQSDLCLVVNPSHALARRKRVSISDLAGEPWVLGAEGGQARDVLEQAFVRAGLHPPEPVVECRPHFLNMHFVNKMPCVTVASRADAVAAEKAGTVCILPVPIALDYGPIALICRKTSSEDTWLTRFRDEAVASIRLNSQDPCSDDPQR